MLCQILYDTTTGRILAARPTATPREDLVLDPDQAVLFADVDFGDSPLASFRMDLATGSVSLRDDWNPPEVGVRLDLTVSGTTPSLIDGIPELPADGTSEAIVTVQKRSVDPDRPLTAASHDNLLTIRTTAGALSERQLALRRGQATFKLRSSTETVLAEVRVSAARIEGVATVRIEFAPRA